jgi:predicted secreted protein
VYKSRRVQIQTSPNPEESKESRKVQIKKSSNQEVQILDSPNPEIQILKSPNPEVSKF